ncbi:MAG: hypothetical protein BM556_15890 [Bacteriovorax sp. MedPE-SWde]|nr:MAG: hypothetical protein BM556_15890 [Bacteriovorax sp. MedPE-SWde]
MKKTFALLFSITLILLSCKGEEIDSKHEVRTATAQQHDKAPSPMGTNSSKPGKKQDRVYKIKGTYYLDTIEVNKPIEGGPRIIQGLGNLIADLIVRIGGNFDVSVDPIPFDVTDIDLDVVKQAVVKKINIEVVDKKKKAKLNFIKKLKLHLEDPNDKSKSVTLINARYKDRNKNAACGDYCFEIDVKNLNLIDFIGDTREIIVIPEVEIGKTPKDNFTIQVAIEFEIGVKMPL